MRSRLAPDEVRASSRLGYFPGVSPQTGRGAIQQALDRHAEHAAKRVQIAITDGKVILTGDVPSWAERNTVEGAVRGTPGVWNVENQLRIHA